MSLRIKFLLLLGLLATTTGVSVAASMWAARLLDRELTRPFARITSALTELHRTKRDVWAQARLILGDEAPGLVIPETPGDGSEARTGPPSDQFRSLGEAIRSRFDALASNDAFIARTGLSTWQNMRDRVETSQAAAARWWDGADADARAAASRELLVVHELIERAETGVLRDAATASAYGAGLRGIVRIVLALAVAVALVAALFAGVRIRAWVLAPVSELRLAATRIAQGDFSHRVPEPRSAPGDTPTSDELTLLGREVNHMAGMVSAMQDERVARERLAAVGEMVRRLAHNLRNPLAGIRALAEVSSAELAPGSELRENQDRIITTVDRFESWLGALLATTSPLAIRPAAQAVGPWLRSLAEALAPMAEAKRVTLVSRTEQAPPEAWFDPRHLEQAIVALLTNAVQATPPEGHVGVTAEGIGDRWRIVVADSGPGIAPELIPRIFEAHFTTKRDGSGMGLALCRQVVLEHGGSVTILRRGQTLPGFQNPLPGDPGAVFVVSLPLRARASHPRPAETGDTDGQNSDHRG